MTHASFHGTRNRERGMSLIIVLLLLVVVSILGVGGAQIATMGERSARNDRDMQMAWQGSESGLMDAEFDIHGGTGTANRSATFANMLNTNAFVSGCNVGLCALVQTNAKPAWLAVDLSDASGKSAGYGDFTGRLFPSGTLGPQPAQVPRYVIEPIPDPASRDLSGSSNGYIFRVTSMGFGPRKDIQAVTQIIYRD